MSEVSAFRLYLLRAMYLLIAAGLATTVWPVNRQTARRRPRAIAPAPAVPQ